MTSKTLQMSRLERRLQAGLPAPLLFVPDQTKSLKREVLIDVAGVARTAGDHSGMSASCDDSCIGAEFLDQAFHHPIDRPDGAVVKSRLHAGNGVLADNIGGLAEINQGQSRRAA